MEINIKPIKLTSKKNKFHYNYKVDDKAFEPNYDEIDYKDFAEPSYEEWKKTSVDAIKNISNGVSVALDATGTVVKRTSATLGLAGLSLLEGASKFGGSLIDMTTILATAAVTPLTLAADALQHKVSDYTGIPVYSLTDELWREEKEFVKKEFVKDSFDAVYANTPVSAVKDNALFNDSVRGIANGLGEATGIVALSILTFGAGGIIASAGTSGASAAASIGVDGGAAIIAGTSGFSEGTGKAWKEGASTGRGLASGTLAGMLKGGQYFLGGKINNFQLISSTSKAAGVANVLSRISLDAVDSGAEGLIEPAIDSIYNGKGYFETFEEAGGMGNVGEKMIMGAIGSAVGELTNEAVLNASFGKKYEELETFFLNMDDQNNHYGVDQGYLKELYDYKWHCQIIDNKLVYTEEKLPNLEFSRLKNKLIEKGFSNNQALQIINGLDSTGACSYASVANGIFAQFKNNPDAFEELFGYSMYTNNSKGEEILNSGELLLDLYTFLNDSQNGGKLFKTDIDGAKIFLSLKTGTDNSKIDLLLDSKNQVYPITSKGVNTELVDKFIKSKNSNYSFSSKGIKRAAEQLNDREIRKLSKRINDDIARGYNMSLSLYYDKNNPAPIRMINLKEGGKDVSTDLWLPDSVESKIEKEIVGHATYITGVEDNGFIVSSWGRKFLITFEDLANSIYWQIDSFWIGK